MSTPLGFGLGLRTQHYPYILEHRPAVDWFEFISENFLNVGGRPRRKLEQFRAHYPLVAHGVGLSIASSDEIPEAYLNALAQLVSDIQPQLVTDHLCWTRHHQQNSHDLLPIAYNQQTLSHVVRRVQQVQERLKRRIFLENPSAYVRFKASDRGEAEFLRALCEQSGCGVLLDINNLFVNTKNLAMDADAYLASLRADDLCYFHLAGHTVLADIRIDTHDEPVPDGVWALYRAAVQRFPKVPTLLEWDDHIPEFPALMAELAIARQHHAEAKATPMIHVRTQTSSTVPAPAASDHKDWPQIQDEFWTLMTGPTNIANGDPRATAIVDTGLPTTGERGLNAYVEAYFFRIADGIRETYPTLDNVIGAKAFYQILRGFIATSPPREASLKYAARGLCDYLNSCELPADYGVSKTVLSAIAALEWARADIYDEADSSPPLCADTLQAFTPSMWEAAQFNFIKSLRLIRCDWAVLPVLQAVDAGKTPQRPDCEPSNYLVMRPDLDVTIKPLSEPAAKLFMALQSGQSFFDACSTAIPGELDADAVSSMIAVLTAWFHEGLITGVRT